MFRVILMQVLATLVVAIVAGWFVGMRGVVSAAAGGAIYTIPNLLFALQLALAGRRTGSASPKVFLFGAFAKIVLTFILLALVVSRYEDLHWPSMLIGLVFATQAMLLPFGKKS